MLKEFEIKEQRYSEEIKRLNTVIERGLQSQKDLEGIIRQKDSEIMELTDPHGIKGNVL